MDTEEPLRLLRIREPGPFAGYIPPNMHCAAKRAENICIGAAYLDKACGAVLAESTLEGWYVRSVYVDPSARLCGLGTYLLRALIGAVQAAGAEELTLMYTPGMLEGGNVSGAFQRAGFSPPQPYASIFTVPLGAIYTPAAPDTRMTAEPILTAPPAVKEAYHQKLISGGFPAFVSDDGFLYPPEPRCCLLAYTEDKVAGAIAVFHDEARKELYVRGLYVGELYRGRGVAQTLIRRALETALQIYGPEYPVRTSPITRTLYELCDRYFMHGHGSKETIFFMACAL